jgi:hypothetical protein
VDCGALHVFLCLAGLSDGVTSSDYYLMAFITQFHVSNLHCKHNILCRTTQNHLFSHGCVCLPDCQSGQGDLILLLSNSPLNHQFCASNLHYYKSLNANLRLVLITELSMSNSDA